MFSYWEQNLYKSKYDYIIVGAGFSGFWLAHFLKKNAPSLKIAILERGSLPLGASTKNAGFACFGSPTEILENIKVLGTSDAMDWTKKRFEGISIIKTHFKDSIDYNPCGATELFNNVSDFEETIEQIAYLNELLAQNLNIQNHFFLDSNTISDCGFKGFGHAISNTAEASIHSAKLYNALYKNLIYQNVNIFYGTEVTEIDEQNASVKTKNLGEFNANHVTICTNAFTNVLFPEFNIKPGRGQVLITEPIPDLKWNKTFHFDKGFYYFRNVGQRILLGGGRNLDIAGETSYDFETTVRIQNQLETMLFEKILPHQKAKIEMRWAGIMAFNESRTPISKIISSKLSANVCMNGMGVALAPTLGQNLALAII